MELSNRINMIDFQRLDNGLATGQRVLMKVEPLQRTQALLVKHDTTALIALYESLCCVDYHKDDAKLASHFDYVFDQIQTRKVLRLSDILPAMARFLFSRSPIRLRFATCAWQKMTASLNPKTFDWVVHDVLSEAIMLVSHPSADPEDIQNFWQGFLLILDKMDESLITHCLRAMEVQPDIYHL